MELAISLAAQKQLASKLNNRSTFLLVSNDGSNQFSSAQGCCMIGDRFLIVSVDQGIAPFTVPIDNALYQVYTSTYDKLFLTGLLQLTVNEGSSTLV